MNKHDKEAIGILLSVVITVPLCMALILLAVRWLGS